MSLADAQAFIFPTGVRTTYHRLGLVVASLRDRLGRSHLVSVATACNGAVNRRHQESKAMAYLQSLDEHTLKDIGINRWEIVTAVRGTRSGRIRRRKWKAIADTLAVRRRLATHVILVLLAAVILAGCGQGKWDARNGIFTLPFGAASAPRVTGRTATALAIPPALGRGRGILVQEAQMFPATDSSQ